MRYACSEVQVLAIAITAAEIPAIRTNQRREGDEVMWFVFILVLMRWFKTVIEKENIYIFLKFQAHFALLA